MNVVKTALMGFPGVGKSTIIKLLSGKPDCELKKEYEPTIGVDFGTVDLFKNLKISLWDLGGQEQFQRIWDSFLSGTGLICAVTDSTPENVARTKDIISRYRNNGAKIIAIANKQDMPNAMKPHEVEKALGVKTIGMVAVNSTTKRMLFQELQKIFTSNY